MIRLRLIFGVALLGFSTLNAQINTSTGGGTSVLPNSPSTNTNVGIGTSNPTSKLEVIGDVKANRGIFDIHCKTAQVFLILQIELKGARLFRVELNLLMAGLIMVQSNLWISLLILLKYIQLFGLI